MFFKKMRSRSKSTSKSTKPSMTRITSSGSSIPNGKSSKIPQISVSPPDLTTQHGSPDDGQNDFQEFLEKAKKDEEDAAKRAVKAAKHAEAHQKQINMSPWASRM